VASSASVSPAIERLEQAGHRDDEHHQGQRAVDVARILSDGGNDGIRHHRREQHGDQAARREVDGHPLAEGQDHERDRHRAVEARQNGGRDVRLAERPEREHAVADAARDGDDAAGDAARDLAAQRRTRENVHGRDYTSGIR
jgi:hypothetical protein